MSSPDRASVEPDSVPPDSVVAVAFGRVALPVLHGYRAEVRGEDYSRAPLRDHQSRDVVGGGRRQAGGALTWLAELREKQ